MSIHAVTRKAGPAWEDAKGAVDQPGAADHAAFMNQLADEGFVLFAGPLSGSEYGRIRVLLVVDSPDEATIHRRLADDPWAIAGKLVMARVEPWTLFVGASRVVNAA